MPKRKYRKNERPVQSERKTRGNESGEFVPVFFGVIIVVVIMLGMN